MTDPRNRSSARDAIFQAKGDHALSFPKGGTALPLIDPVNDSLSGGGAAWDLTKATVQMRGVIGNLKLYRSRSPSVHE